ncbi:YheC/YheD family protein [Gracilibacillus saliphilus]|uniref:YheC/YheD family protein n=1 Tax=Gracilibacillus saliphilus TaxID=543890 RepID=UPI0013D2092B|nr:YheC/YheD family protein [Gracilibacillus saliphilus]
MESINKWSQTLKIKQNPLLSQHYPETVLYSSDNLNDFLNRYAFIYVKPISNCKGRGVVQVGTNTNGQYTVKGYTITGSKVDRELNSLEAVIMFLHSIYRRKLNSNLYIIQQGISSVTPDKLALGVRAHIQYVQGKWVLGGMLGKLADIDSGIVNRNRGAWALPIRQLLLQHLQMDQQQAEKLEKEIERICIEVGKVFGENRRIVECGIDIGIDQLGKVWVFEVNLIGPSIEFFSYLKDKSIFNQILENRRKRRFKGNR